MVREERFYAFIVTSTSRSRARFRRICLQKKWLKVSGAIALVVVCAAGYGLYGLTQRAAHLRIAMENQHLKAETEKQRRELNDLNHRVEAVENTSRKLAEKSGVSNDDGTKLRGAGGPALPLDAAGLGALEEKMSRLEKILSASEAVFRERGFTPSIWPVQGKLESGFGGRRNPFGGRSFEFHAGQDIVTAWGSPVIAGAKGKVSFVGWQRGYGQLVVIEHGGGLTSRYGHLSHIDCALGQEVTRGQFIGRVGSTGRSTGPHLHYEIRINDDPVDPLPYLITSARQ